MKRFKDNQRVRVLVGALTGREGTVVRLRRGDDGAWVNMDAELPPRLRAFPAKDQRARHAMLYPDECEAIG